MAPVPGSGQLVAGRYQLIDQIGRGAMGIVWRGRDQLLDRDVAVKQIVLSPLTSQTQAEASFQRTLREARIAARLSHPSVVTVFDVVEQDGAPWIVMELIHARSLDQVIAEDGPLPPARAAQLGLTLLEALATAHAAGVLHRDVKPSNVLIKPDGKAVLTDFGIATIQGDPSLTQAGMVVGTPGFSPPERIRGDAATPASDLWSLGATLYAAVEGRGPFDRAGGSAAIIASAATEPAPRAPSAGPLAPVIDALLRADPADRPNAAITKRLLADARSTTGARGPAGAQGPAGAGSQAGAGSLAGARGEERNGPDATTATQVVTVPPGADHPAQSPIDAAVINEALIDEAPEGPASMGMAPMDSTPPGAALLGAVPADAGQGDVAPALAGVARAGADLPGNFLLGTDIPETGYPGAGHPSAGYPGADHPGALSATASDVVPDLMATPIFADLKMPDGTGPDGSPLPGPGKQALSEPTGDRPGTGQSPVAGTKPHRLTGNRRALLLVAPLAVIGIVVGVTSLLLHGFPTTLAQGLDNVTRGSGNPHGSAPADHSSPPGHSTDPRHHGGTAGDHPTPGSQRTPGKPSPDGRPSSSGKPTPKTTPSGSHSPSPSLSPTPSPSPVIPPGYTWFSVSASSVGTTAGFRLAAPNTWALIPGVTSTIKPSAGGMHMTVDMAPLAVPSPFKDARHLQAAAIMNHTYRAYHLISILAVTFHGRPAATWTFWWKPSVQAKAIDVTKLIYTANTSGGPQPYILTMASSAPGANLAAHILHVAMRTFKPLP